MSKDEYGTFEVDQHITAHSKYFVGNVGSRFYMTLKDEKKILGIKCNQCNKVFWPPRSTCGKCFSQLKETDMTEIGPVGTVESFTHVTYSEPVHPRKAPFIYGIIKLDGADTALLHYLDDIDHTKIKIGMRVKALFSGERKASIQDIQYHQWNKFLGKLIRTIIVRTVGYNSG